MMDVHNPTPSTAELSSVDQGFRAESVVFKRRVLSGFVNGIEIALQLRRAAFKRQTLAKIGAHICTVAAGINVLSTTSTFDLPPSCHVPWQRCETLRTGIADSVDASQECTLSERIWPGVF